MPRPGLFSPQPDPPPVYLRDFSLLRAISKRVAVLSNEKVYDILACAAMYHEDVPAAIQHALFQQRDNVRQKSSVLLVAPGNSIYA